MKFTDDTNLALPFSFYLRLHSTGSPTTLYYRTDLNVPYSALAFDENKDSKPTYPKSQMPARLYSMETNSNNAHELTPENHVVGRGQKISEIETETPVCHAWVVMLCRPWRRLSSVLGPSHSASQSKGGAESRPGECASRGREQGANTKLANETMNDVDSRNSPS